MGAPALTVLFLAVFVAVLGVIFLTAFLAVFFLATDFLVVFFLAVFFLVSVLALAEDDRRAELAEARDFLAVLARVVAFLVTRFFTALDDFFRDTGFFGVAFFTPRFDEDLREVLDFFDFKAVALAKYRLP
jgi:hypothetical protein